LTIRREIGRAASIVRLLREQLGLPVTNSFVKSISETKLRESIDGVLDQQMVQNIAQKLDISITETEHLLINLSLDCDLLPDEILDTIDPHVSAADLEDLMKSISKSSWTILSKIRKKQEGISLKPTCVW
jgi:hypothetical protein